MTEPQESDAKGRGPTPSASAMTAYLQGPGRLQTGSRFIKEAGRIWFRPLKGGMWYADKAHISHERGPPYIVRPEHIIVKNLTSWILHNFECSRQFGEGPNEPLWQGIRAIWIFGVHHFLGPFFRI
jgi:hypothetical protein